VIRFEIQGRIGVATIDRPERRNALNAELCEQLRGHLERSGDLRAIVITGAGTAFCAGADLVTRFAREADATTDTFRPSFEEVLDAIVACSAPVIAAINGPAIGAGMQLAVACDVRVAAAGARLAIPGGKLGIHLSARNIWRLVQLVGQGAARDFLLAGRTVDADEALRLGLVQYVEPDAASAALALAADIAASAPLTMRGHKRSLNLIAEAQWLADGARTEIAALEAGAFASNDLQEGMAAFAEKRTPEFHGN
jgi:enoyl-CoA hydratase/carnithine racemase